MEVAVGIAGSAKVEGATPTSGAPGTAGIMSGATPGAKKALYIWLAAFGVLFIFHIGGARLG